MKTKFEYITGYTNRFNTLKEALTFAETHEIDEVGITKDMIYQPLYRYNPMSETYHRKMKVNNAKISINKFLNSNN